LRFPWAGRVSVRQADSSAPDGLPRVFWLYAGCAGLIGFGFVDWPLVAFHFAQAKVVSEPAIPVVYALAMGGSGAGALAMGRFFDRYGFIVLMPAILIAAAVAPLAFLGSGWVAMAGGVLWGIVLGAENSVLAAGVAHLVPDRARAGAYGIFSAVFGIAWFAGSALLGALYDISFSLLVGLSVLAELAALVPLYAVIKARG
jgi:MFS family permease